jgi:hypothetical protein
MKLNPEFEVGEVVEIQAGPAGCALPYGLGVGFQVRLVAVEAHHRIVEREGREWRVCVSNLQPRQLRRLPGVAVPAAGRCRR